MVLGPISLLTNATATFTGAWIPANPCAPSTAMFVAQGVDILPPEAVTVHASTSTMCSETLTPAIAVTEACPEVPVSPGQTLTYSGTVTNTGNVTLTNVVVVSSQPAPNTVVFTAATLAPGAGATFTGSYTAPAACTSASTVTGTGNSVCGVGVTASANATCPIAIAPQITVVEACPTNSPAPGGMLVYRGLVSNPGNIALKNIVVTSDHPVPNTVVFTAASLAPGASASFAGSFVTPANTCSVTSSLQATGSDICAGSVVTNVASSTCPLSVTPIIGVTVACPNGTLTPGGSVTYTGRVFNSGNDTLINVTVSATGFETNLVVLSVPSLAPGASSNFTAAVIAPADSCSVSTTVMVTGSDSCGSVAVTNLATATCPLVTAPQISVTQSCPDTPVIPGGVLTYSGTVGNPGNITLTNVVVTSDKTGTTPVFTAAILAPGATLAFTGSYTVPSTANCLITSTLTASGYDKCNAQVVSAKAASTCPLGGTPSVQVTLACPATPPLPGATLAYSGTVVNNGTIPLTNVVVVSDHPAINTVVFRATILAAGASAAFTGSYVAPTNACSVTSSVSVTAQEMCAGTAVANTATSTCPLNTTPAISVSLACPAGPLTPGGTVSYTGTVVNHGNDTLLNVVVSAAARTRTGIVTTIPSLGPGASTPFTASFTVPPDSCSFSATASAIGTDSCSSASVTNSASATCPLTVNPQIAVTQSCPASPASPGGVLTYSGTVSNPGNITLTNVIVLSDQTGSTPVFTAPSLAPGATLSFTGSYTVPATANCSVTSTLTASAGGKCNGQPVSAKTTSTCPLLIAPSIAVTLACPTNNLPVPSGSITYTGVVLNDGNITLSNIVVTSPTAGGSNTVVFTVATLAAHASANFTFTKTVPPNCCTVASEVVATGAEICGGTAVTDSDTTTCNVLTSPKLLVTKQCPTNAVATGELLTFEGTVANAGDITIIGVTVVDSMSPSNSVLLGPIDLAPGQTVAYTGSYTVPPDFCGTDTVTASGADMCTGSNVTTSVTTTCPILTTPQISVTKICPAAPVPRGGNYVFTGFVTNSGNVTLTNVMVVDDMPTNPTPVLGPITLAPGGSMSFTGSYTAPFCCCVMVDTLTASGQGSCDGTRVTATSTAVCPLLTTPSLVVTKICPAQPVPVGSVFAFSGSVSNTGDITLTNVTVVSSQPGGTASLLGPIDLAPGESETFTGSYTVTTNDNPTGDIVMASGGDICAGATITVKANCLGIVPLAAQPVIGPVTGRDGPFTVTWSATAGATYALQYKTSFSDTSWITLPGTVTATGTTASMTDNTANSSQRFYRVMVVVP